MIELKNSTRVFQRVMMFVNSVANYSSVFRMSGVSYLVLFFISHLLLFSLAKEEKGFGKQCQPFDCGILGHIKFPFSNETHPECGLLRVDNCSEGFPSIRLGKDVPKFYVSAISEDHTLTLQALPGFEKPPSDNRSCLKSFRNFTVPSFSFLSFELRNIQTLFKCPGTSYSLPVNYETACNDSKNSIIYYIGPNHHHESSTVPSNCSLIPSKMNKTQKGLELLNLYTGYFKLHVNVSRECRHCFHRGGNCQIDNHGKFHSPNARTDAKKSKLGVEIGIGIGGSTVAIAVLLTWFIRRKKQKYESFNSRFISSDPSSRSGLEVGSVCFGVPVFSYKELAEATSNFNHEKELGDGGFGRVYYAQLKDGREVAVKRFHEHNYRKFEQFMNEIEILARLRHKNLLSLYGCTSRHSPQGLLLVYEFIPNGTVADHLHRGRAKPGSLPWPIRINIAIETASALAYLHASDIIHRDVKTNNILLDNNFSVKVADFGLSRLFPTDVTHVSTAPQGSPGYVDPEYHLCYQLTDKSDVYSFGVVLIELISSMPAVDMNRHKHEINLAYFAVNRIQNSAIEELIDPSLGFQSDEEVKRMTTSVAELAFLCLQQNKEMRPSMDLVTEQLKRIESGECKPENLNNGNVFKSTQPAGSSPDYEGASLLKIVSLSPTSVTAKWVSSDIASSVSCQGF